ncbi:MAG: 16S rRNA (cytosine(1402)-N(4))-methyltransferase RsmH [Lachnospiraceae bacterium]|nr:16S rRNA (cytosine(1402)-N(4))-methyltransferase RsmH [Lachnospiraceae bacterium]
MEFSHVPVLLRETIRLLNIRSDGIYLDATVGGGGHSFEIASRLNAGEGGRLICLDQDREAVEAAAKRLEPFGGMVTLIHDNFGNMGKQMSGLGISALDGILMDLGVSSFQLDYAERGFSYLDSAPLDMRMNRENPLTAKEIVNTYEKEELERIFREYGEERFAGRIAGEIVKRRSGKPVTDTIELRDIVEEAIPGRVRRSEHHPAKRVFQALRIEVNNELGILTDVLDEAVELLKPGGRLAIITFHSLEDRIVKQGMKRNELPCICPKEFPVCTCGRVSRGKVVTRKPVTAGEEELNSNPRSRSAKLRVFEKNGNS